MILFQLQFEVAADRGDEFEKAYAEVFEPALVKQKGFQNVKLLRLYAPAQAAEIEAFATKVNYQINFVFDSESSRRAWARSADHDVAWPRLSGIARSAVWCGYDVLAGSPRP
jgi:heme-degrading monooxygenase HmoA